MVTILRRFFVVGLVGGGGYAGWTFWRQRRSGGPDPAPEWPPLDPPTTDTIAANVPTAEPRPPADTGGQGFTTVPSEAPEAAPTDSKPHPDAVEPAGSDAGRTLAEAIADPIEPPTPSWVAPVAGRCPEGYPIKANDNSGIYHVPGGRFYDRTVPERCYADAEAAEADGYRAAKS